MCVCVCGSSGGGSLMPKATQPATSQATGYVSFKGSICLMMTPEDCWNRRISQIP